MAALQDEQGFTWPKSKGSGESMSAGVGVEGTREQ